jgi:hypothetical protein
VNVRSLWGAEEQDGGSGYCRVFIAWPFTASKCRKALIGAGVRLKHTKRSGSFNLRRAPVPSVVPLLLLTSPRWRHHSLMYLVPKIPFPPSSEVGIH